MKTLLAFILLASSMANAHVIPVDNSVMLVQDELFPYQWGLLNQGQSVIREKDDIHNVTIAGVPGKDIGWKNLVGRFVTKRPIVAVLDSGVDLTHPELQGNLWKNEKECGKDPKVDNDGNKLAGDCHGWNFTEPMDSDLAKDPSDKDGHGTHIAGIIASLNNGYGIVGVNPNALIMPVKVMRDSDSTSDIPSSDSFARGIIYAVDNGADVINMSLGWPRALETKILRDAVYYALGQGVAIIAAAGNNNSSEPLYPCAYDGVVCVGATSPDGKFAPFSNFGGHVDTVAPGEGILSLNPIKFEPEFFSVSGFELRSGTSQAAPYVAGMVASLKAKNPDLKIDDLFAKLYQALKMKDSSKNILGGISTWEDIDRDVTIPVIRPVFKQLRQILFRAEAVSAQFPITVRNFGTEANNVSIKVESLSPGFVIDSEEQVLSNLGQGKFKELIFKAQVSDLSAESNVSLKMSITVDGETSSYINQVPVVRDIRSDSKFKRASFVFTDKPLPVGTIREGQVLSQISTLGSYTYSSKREYFMRRTIKEESILELTLFTKKGDKLVQHPSLIKVPNAISLVSFVKADVNFDGKEDYVVHTLSEKDKKRYFTFSFYNEDLKPLWDSFQDVKLVLDLNVESFNDIYFMKLEDAKLGKILVPSFFTKGTIPKLDQVLTSWDKPDARIKSRLYYLEPFNGAFRVRSKTTNVWEESLKKELKSKWFETVDSEQILTPSETDAKNGVLRVVVSVGIDTKRQILIHTFDAKSVAHGKALPQLVLQTSDIDPLVSITDHGLVNSGDVYLNIYDNTRAKIVTTKGDAQSGEYVIRHDDPFDLVAGHIASFESQDKRLTIYQTREKLITVSSGAQNKKTTRAKLRYSFLSQKLLSEMYFPVSYKRNNVSSAGLYVDATPITSNRIYLFEDQNGELVSSIRNSILVPPGCKTLTPGFNDETKNYEFVFLCLEDKEFVLRSYEMN